MGELRGARIKSFADAKRELEEKSSLIKEVPSMAKNIHVVEDQNYTLWIAEECGQLFLILADLVNMANKPIAYALPSGVERAVRMKKVDEETKVRYTYHMATDSDFQLQEIMAAMVTGPVGAVQYVRGGRENV